MLWAAAAARGGCRQRCGHGVAALKGLLFFLSVPMIGAILGHQYLETTARYTHLVHDPGQEAAEQAGAALLREFKG